MTADAPDLACRELVEIVTDYLEERLSAEDRARFDRHVAGCDGCRTYLEQMRQVLAAAGKIREGSIGSEPPAELLHAFRDWKKRRGGKP